MSKKIQSPIATRFKKLFNIDKEAKKCYPKIHTDYNPSHSVPVFNKVKHFTMKGMFHTFQQAA